MNYIKQLLILVSSVTGCVSVSVFSSLVGIPVGISSSAVEFKICVITEGIKNYKSLIKKKKKQHNKIVLLAKSKLNSIKVVISKALTVSNNTHDDFVLINNAFKEYDQMKEEIKNLKF